MKHLYRSLAHNYREGGLRLLATKFVTVAALALWSTDRWVIYQQTPIMLTSDQVPRTQHRLLGFDELVHLGYAKALAFPETIRGRFARGDSCHGFFHSGELVTVGWSGAGYMELDVTRVLACPGAWGLFDFMTLPAFQGKGFYTESLRQIARLAREGGFDSMWIAVHPKNVPSIKGIERSGFRPARIVSKRRVLGVSTLRSQELEI